MTGPKLGRVTGYNRTLINHVPVLDSSYKLPNDTVLPFEMVEVRKESDGSTYEPHLVGSSKRTPSSDF